MQDPQEYAGNGSLNDAQGQAQDARESDAAEGARLRYTS